MRKKTLLREQLLHQTDELLEKSKASGSQLGDRPKSGKSGDSGDRAGLLRTDEDTDAIIEDDDDEVFGNLKFRSFKRHKQMEEDYDLLTIEDPEDLANINTVASFPEDKVVKEAVEVVPVTKNELQV